MSEFRTERLVARQWTEQPADLRRLFDIYSRWEVARWLGAQPKAMAEPGQAVDAVRRWRARCRGPYGVWAIEVRDTGLIAGTVLLVPLRLSGDAGEDPDAVEVGWHLHPDSQGRGYATEAARGALDRAFAAGVPAVYAVVRPGNEPSVAVTRRLGMEPLGRTDRWYDTELDAFKVQPAIKQTNSA